MQDGIGAIVGPLHGRDDAAAVHLDEGGSGEVPRKLLWQLGGPSCACYAEKKQEHLGFLKHF